MAYKEKLEQQGSHRRRKFSTHLDIPDRDVLFRSEVSSTVLLWLSKLLVHTKPKTYVCLIMLSLVRISL